MKYRGKRIIVTGAANGLGRAFCAHLSSKGGQIIAIDIDKNQLQKVKASYNNIDIYPGDIRSFEGMTKIASSLSTKYEFIDGLINNAAVSHTGRIDQTNISDFKWVIETNLLGTFYCVKAFLPLIPPNEESFILNISSGIAFQGFSKFSAYASSKAAIRSFTECLRAESYASKITVASAYPGPIKTNMPSRARHIYAINKEKEIKYLLEKGYAPKAVAASILKKLAKGKKEILIGKEVWWGYHLKRLFPRTVEKIMFRNQNKLPV